MENYSVQAILSAVDKGFTKTLSGASKTLDNLSRHSQSSANSVMRIASGIGVFKALSVGANMLASSIDGAIDRYDTLNKYPRVLKSLGYSSQEAAESTKKLKNGIQGLPTTLNDVVSTSQRLTVLTGNLEKSTDTTLALNNAFLASGASTADASRGLEQYVQMLSKGTVDMQSWRTLQETMGYALSETAKKLGIASGNSLELYDALQSGQITFDEFNDALVECSERTGGFAEMALTASGGIKTSMTNIHTAVKNGMEGCIRAIDSMLEHNGLPKIEQMLNNVKKGIGVVFGSWEQLEDGTIQFNGGLAEAISKFDNIKGLTASVGAVLGASVIGAGSFDYLNILPKLFNFASVKGSNAFKKLEKGAQTFTGRVDNIKTKLDLFADSAIPKCKKLGAGIGNIIPPGIKKKFEDLSDISSGTFIQMREKATQFGDGIGAAFFRFSTATGRFEKDAPKMWQVFDTLSNKAGNLSKAGPAIGKGLQKGASVGVTAMNGMASALTTVMSVALRTVGPAAILGIVLAGLGILQGQFGDQINSIISMAATKGPEIITNLVNSIVDRIPELASAGALMLAGILNAITANIPAVISGGVAIIEALVQGVMSNINTIIPAVLNLITTFASSVISALPQILMLGLQMLLSLVQGILDNMDLFVQSVTSVIETLSTAVTENLPLILELGLQILLALAQGIIMALPQIIVAAVEALTQFINTLSENLPQVLQTAVEIITTLVEGILENLPQLVSAAAQLVVALVSAIVSDLPQVVSAGLQIIVTLASGLIRALPQIVSAGLKLVSSVAQGIRNGMSGVASAAKGIITAVGSAIKSCISSAVKWGSDIVSGIANGIKGAIGKVTSAVSDVANSIKSFLHFSRPDKGPLRPYEKWMPDFMKGIAKGITGNIDLVEKAVSKVADTMNLVTSVGVTPVISVADFSGESLRYEMAGDVSMNVEYQSVGSMLGDFVDEMRELIQDENRIFSFNITSEMDGRAVSKGTAVYIKEELDRMEKRDNRKHGRR